MVSEELPVFQHETAELQRWTLVSSGGRLLGLEFGRVREVIPSRPYTSLPGAPAAVRGVVNRRGRILTVVDLAVQLQMAPSADNPAHRVVVVAYGEREIGVAVDDVLRITQLPEDALTPVDGEGPFLMHAGESEGQSFHTVDVTALLQPLFG